MEIDLNEVNKMLKKSACFTGPRPEKLLADWDESHPEILRIKAELKDKILLAAEDGCRTFWCGMARGIDIIAAETLLSLKRDFGMLNLAAAIPYQNQRSDQPLFWRIRYDTVLKQCEQVEIISETYRNNCYADRNRFMVDQSDRLIAVVNSDSGGTAYTLRYALKKGIPCEVIRTDLITYPGKK
jgi:uncharacterized phage-like protein YoqJ